MAKKFCLSVAGFCVLLMEMCSSFSKWDETDEREFSSFFSVLESYWLFSHVRTIWHSFWYLSTCPAQHKYTQNCWMISMMRSGFLFFFFKWFYLCWHGTRERPGGTLVKQQSTKTIDSFKMFDSRKRNGRNEKRRTKRRWWWKKRT